MHLLQKQVTIQSDLIYHLANLLQQNTIKWSKIHFSEKGLVRFLFVQYHHEF